MDFDELLENPIYLNILIVVGICIIILIIYIISIIKSEPIESKETFMEVPVASYLKEDESDEIKLEKLDTELYLPHYTDRSVPNAVSDNVEHLVYAQDILHSTFLKE